jgi:hypothetical protein
MEKFRSRLLEDGVTSEHITVEAKARKAQLKKLERNHHNASNLGFCALPYDDEQWKRLEQRHILMWGAVEVRWSHYPSQASGTAPSS